MIIKVVDQNRVVISVFDGIMEGGAFHYKEGGIVIPLWNKRILAKDKILDIKYGDSIIEGKNKINYVMFDGKDYKPMILHHINYTQQDHSIQDYLNLNRQAEQAENETLQKPANLQQILSILLLICCVAIPIIMYYMSSNLLAQGNANYQILNKTLQNQGTELGFIVKHDNQTDILFNKTLALLNKGS